MLNFLEMTPQDLLRHCGAADAIDAYELAATQGVQLTVSNDTEPLLDLYVRPPESEVGRFIRLAYRVDQGEWQIIQREGP